MDTRSTHGCSNEQRRLQREQTIREAAYELRELHRQMYPGDEHEPEWYWLYAEEMYDAAMGELH